MNTRRRPGTLAVFGVMAFPALLLLALIVLTYMASGSPSDEVMRSRLPLILLINHGLAFGFLLLVLRKQGLSLADIGWCGPFTRRVVLGEVATALTVALAFYLFKELVTDSVVALASGRNPTFTSLFAFRLRPEEGGLLLAAVGLVFVEESIFRGYALTRLGKDWSMWKAVLASSAFFAVLHWGNGATGMLHAFMGGILFSIAFALRRRLWGVTGGHALYNAATILT